MFERFSMPNIKPKAVKAVQAFTIGAALAGGINTREASAGEGFFKDPVEGKSHTSFNSTVEIKKMPEHVIVKGAASENVTTENLNGSVSGENQGIDQKNYIKKEDSNIKDVLIEGIR